MSLSNDAKVEANFNKNKEANVAALVQGSLGLSEGSVKVSISLRDAGHSIRLKIEFDDKTNKHCGMSFAILQSERIINIMSFGDISKEYFRACIKAAKYLGEIQWEHLKWTWK